MSLQPTPTMRQILELIGITTADELVAEANTHMNNEPLRRVNESLREALMDLEHAEQVMHREAHSLRAAVDRELANLDEGYVTSDWPTHHAARLEAGREQLNRAIGQIQMLAPLRRMLLAAT